MRRLTLALALLLAAAGCADSQTETEDAEATTDDPITEQEAAEEVERQTGEAAQRLFENEYVEVMRARLAPGDSLPAHEGGARVVYALSDYRIRFQQGGREMERAFSQGDVHVHEAGPHRVTNIGNAPAEFVVFERRSAALPAPPDSTRAEDLAEEAAPAKQDVLLENETAEVHEVTLETGERLSDHRGFERLVYSLSDYRIRLTQDGSAEKRSFAAGDVHWHAPGIHSIENIGGAPARFLVVEFKPQS